MITYYGSTISPNQLETGEGFLICRNVPIARTGVQKYRAKELGLDGDPDRIVEVVRDEEEVFAPETMASFEGKPVTNNHPSEQVDPENARFYERGHVQNVRRGTGEQSDLLIGDLHIHDAELIGAVKRKKKPKREISCGYECEYEEDESGVLHQTNIRGNHVAVVDSGRAGSRVAIVDNSIDTPEKAERTHSMSKKNSILKLFGLAAKNASEEELNKLVTDTGDALEGETVSEEVQKEVSEAVADAPLTIEAVAEMVKGLDAKLDGIVETLSKMLPAEDETSKEETLTETKETIEDALEKIGEESAVIEAEKTEETDACKDACKDTALDSAIQAHILSAVNGAVNGITDEAQRQAVSDALLGAVRVTKDDMSALIDAQKTLETPKEFTTEAIQKAYDAMNPHKK